MHGKLGLTRQWLPKKTDLAKVREKKIVKIENWLNNRLRKCLNYKTPLEVWEKERSIVPPQRDWLNSAF